MSKSTSRDKLLDVTFREVYIYGYAGASIANILKTAGVPKGSMYHHFPSKKEMVIAMIKERLIPKVRGAFFIDIHKDSRATQILNFMFRKIGKNEMLIKHGCPLHKLMFEMGSLDDEITKLCHKELIFIIDNLAKLLDIGKEKGDIREEDSKSLAKFIIISSWGALSLAPKYSSKEQFLQDTKHILEYIKA